MDTIGALICPVYANVHYGVCNSGGPLRGITTSILVLDLQQGVSVSDAYKAVKSEGEMNELEGWGEEFVDREGEINEAKDNCKATLHPNMEKSHILVWPMLEPPGYRYGFFKSSTFYDNFFQLFRECFFRTGCIFAIQ